MGLHDKLIRTAKKSPCKFRVAAAVTDKHGDVVGLGYNKPRFRHRGGGIHAEVDAIRNGGKNGLVLHLVRIGRDGDIRPISPCVACKKLLVKLGIKWR